MAVENRSWTSPEEIDRMIADSDPAEILNHYGYPLPERPSGKNYRLKCPIEECESERSSYGQLSVEESPPYRIKCFSCGVRGKLLELMWIHKHRRQPSGGKLRGDEFKEVLADLTEFNGSQFVSNAKFDVSKSPNSHSAPQPNVPMTSSDNERVRAQADLWTKGVTDPAEMSPAASRYFRARPFLSPEVCQKWGVSYVTGKSTLRNRVVYRIDDVQGRTLAYAGRDPDFDANLKTWRRTGKGKEPIKTRFPSEEYFRKGLELYGQQQNRLEELGVAEKVRELGVWIYEGMNDVLASDHHGQPALAAMSNRLTRYQVEKVVRFVKAVQAPGVGLAFDRDGPGNDGQREAICQLAKHVPVIDLWGEYEGSITEPEQWDRAMISKIQSGARDRWHNSTGQNGL